MKSSVFLTACLILMYCPVCYLLTRWGFALRWKRKREREMYLEMAVIRSTLGCPPVLPRHSLFKPGQTEQTQCDDTKSEHVLPPCPGITLSRSQPHYQTEALTVCACLAQFPLSNVSEISPKKSRFSNPQS